MTYQAHCILAHQAQLGEGPVWDSRRGVLYYVDITAKEIRCYTPASGACRTLSTQQMPGCIVPDTSGRLVAAETNTLVQIDPDSGVRRDLQRLALPEFVRFNDGKCDAAGRLLAGTMAANQSHPEAKTCGAFYALADGKPPRVLRQNMAIPNGIAFSRDSRFLYHTDTPTQQIIRYAYDPAEGSLTDPQPVITIPGADGSPDGMTIDCEGMLWIALWGGYQVARYDPVTGQKLDSVAVPARFVSCCTFGGPDLQDLFITTAMDDDGGGGELYVCRTGTHGFAPYPYQYQTEEVNA